MALRAISPVHAPRIPHIIRGNCVKYPKLAAAIDEMLAKLVRDNGEDVVTLLVAGAIAREVEPVVEKLPPIPTTKEEVLDGN